MAWRHKIQKIYLSGFSRTYGAGELLMQKLAWFTGFVCFLAACGIWIYQAFVWLRTGDWQAMSWASQFGDITFSGWAGVKMLLSSAAQLNLGLVALITGWVIMLAFRTIGVWFRMSAMEVDDQVKQVKRREMGYDE